MWFCPTISLHSGRCPASTSCCVCSTSLSASCFLFRAVQLHCDAEFSAMTRNFRLHACCCSLNLLLLLLEAALVFLDLVFCSVSAQTNFAFSPLICRSKAATWACSRRFLSGRVGDGDGAGVTLFALALPPAAQHFIQSWSLVTLPSLTRQCLLMSPAFPLYQDTGPPSLRRSAEDEHVPAGPLISCLIVSLAGVPAATFAASSYRTWLRASLSDLFPPMQKCCFTSLFINLLMNSWASCHRYRDKDSVCEALDGCCRLLLWLTDQLDPGFKLRSVGRASWWFP
jgi:hypothetical protein